MSLTKNVVLSLFDYSTIMVQPWLAAGLTCICVDIKHPPGITKTGNLYRIGTDIRTWLPPLAEYSIAFAFPPCTHIAVSGAKHFKSKGLNKLIDSLILVNRARELLQWSLAPHMIENPVSVISSYWRLPDHYFDPCDYGGYLGGESDNYVKKTCLWIGRGFIMPTPKPIYPEDGSRMHYLPPSSDRAELRAKTPAGFARAVFEANFKE